MSNSVCLSEGATVTKGGRGLPIGAGLTDSSIAFLLQFAAEVETFKTACFHADLLTLNSFFNGAFGLLV